MNVGIESPSTPFGYRDLFTNKAIEFPATKNAGVSYSGPLSPYVLNQLPIDLEEVAESSMTYQQLAEKHGLLIEDSLDKIKSNENPAQAEIDQLDMLFMQGGYLPLRDSMPEVVPSNLTEAINANSLRLGVLTPFMSYEGIIDVNSRHFLQSGGEIRTYTNGSHYLNERDFYLGHYISEPLVKGPTILLKEIVTSDEAMPDAERALGIALKSLRTFALHMAWFKTMPNESFSYLRKYWSSYPDGTRNASGAFMPSVQLLELSLSPPTEMYAKFIGESMKYFPRWAQPLIAEGMEDSAKGRNIRDALGSGSLVMNPAAMTSLRGILNEFIAFRMNHLGVTRNKIPEAFSSVKGLTKNQILEQGEELEIFEPTSQENTGTAGFDVRNILANSVYRLLCLRELLATEKV